MTIEQCTSSPLTQRIEKIGFIPSLSLKPHHFTLINVQFALRRIEKPKLIAALDTSIQLLRKTDNPGYHKDLLGKETQRDIQRFQYFTEIYFSKLSKLPQDSFIHLDIKPDGLCAAACRGRHCVSTNYQSNHPPRNTVDSETKYMVLILNDLEKAGYRLGIDFIERETQHTLFDLEGRTLDDPIPGKPIRITFNSLIVKTSALRDERVRGQSPQELDFKFMM